MAQSENRVEKKVACELCGKEVALSEAKTAQHGDDVVYFCRIECLVEWNEQEARSDEGGKGA